MQVQNGVMTHGTMRLDEAALLGLEADPNTYGRALGDKLFSADALQTGFAQALAVSEAAGRSMRVRLRLDPHSPALGQIRWERLFAPFSRDNWQPLGTTARTPFSRFLDPDWAQPRCITDFPVRVLVIVASPTNLGQYGMDPIPETERIAQHELWEDLARQYPIELTWLESSTSTPPTLAWIRQALAQGPHIVHFLCHGSLSRSERIPGLYLEDESNKVQWIASSKLTSAFNAAVDPTRPTQFCFLAACESARQSKQEAFAPLGADLVTLGKAMAVIAMTEKVGMTTARVLTENFYNRLFTHGYLDRALNEARVQVWETWDWGVPVLFRRLPDNRLFGNITASPPVKSSPGIPSYEAPKASLISTTKPAKFASPEERKRFRKNLIEYLSEQEIKELCFDIGIDYEELEGTTKGSKVISLIVHIERRLQLAGLLEALIERRPDIPW